MPMRVRRQVGVASRSAPWKLIAPLETLRIPMMLFMSVVLPAPLRPMSPAIVPTGSASETSRRIRTDWIETLRFSTLSTQHPTHHVALHLRIGERNLRRRVGDDAPVVEREHAPGKAAYHLHVVLDKQHRGALGAHRRRSEEHTSELQSRLHLVCRLLLEKKKTA